jgi:predicted nucleotide-binding protein
MVTKGSFVMSGSKPNPEKRSRVSQSDFPNISLEETLRIARGIWDNFAGKGAAPHNVAMALDLSPTSGGWRNLCGASIAYGLTEGGYAANEITLTELGRRAVAPTSEGDDQKALQIAALTPRILGEFFKQYDRAKFPRDDIAANVLVEKGLPKDRVASLVDLLKRNGQFVGFIKQTKTGPFVSLDVAESGPSNGQQSSVYQEVEEQNEWDNGHAEDLDIQSSPVSNVDSAVNRAPAETVGNKRVFITHGKNHAILDQIKEVVELGGFEPIISTRIETAAKPIPDKVMDDMRSCVAAVIHVGSEGVLTDDEGNTHAQINPNVLIEIGAAMALYKGKFILVVEEGVTLPSNLQGLYESRYTGSAFAFQAGMKILKALKGMNVS